LIVPPHDFDLVSGRDDLTTYTFNTGVARQGLRDAPVLCTSLGSR
jgi:hypothetical protein